MGMKTDYRSIILFDGVCNFCNNSIQFIIKRDKKKHFKFASLQSDIGQQLLDNYALPKDLSSIVLIDEGQVYTKSTAVLKIALHLKNMWNFFYVFILVPKNIRDEIYSWFAKNRYQWFGKNSTVCEIPSLEVRQRFFG
ncbi:MAG: thiol-disulfide oxidoreductase DCC family protein [Bacteroidota bacterium]